MTKAANFFLNINLKSLILTLLLKPKYSSIISQYFGWWRPKSLHRQHIKSNGIEYKG